MNETSKSEQTSPELDESGKGSTSLASDWGVRFMVTCPVSVFVSQLVAYSILRSAGYPQLYEELTYVFILFSLPCLLPCGLVAGLTSGSNSVFSWCLCLSVAIVSGCVFNPYMGILFLNAGK